MTAPTIISRADATARHVTTYYTGKPCKAGHVERRYVSNGACIVCAKSAAATFNDSARGRNAPARWDALNLQPVHPDDRAALYALADFLNQQRGLPSVTRPTVEPVAPPVDPRTLWEVWYDRLRAIYGPDRARAMATDTAGPETHSPGWVDVATEPVRQETYGGGAKPDYL